MTNKDHIEWIYMRIYGFSVISFSVLCLILILVTNFAYWLDPNPVYIRLSSNFRISLLVLLPLFLGFFVTSIFSGMMMFTNMGKKELWNILIFWVSLGIMAATIIASGVILIALSILNVEWGYGLGFFGSLMGSVLIALSSFIFFKVKQELQS